MLYEGAQKGSSRRSRLTPEEQNREYAVLNYLENGDAAKAGALRSATGVGRGLLEGMVKKKWLVREALAEPGPFRQRMDRLVRLICRLHDEDQLRFRFILMTQHANLAHVRPGEANPVEIVVALIDNNEVTLKRLRRKGQAIALEPANPAFETRIFGADRVRVQGRLVGLLRHY